MAYPSEWVDIVAEIVHAHPTWSEDMLIYAIHGELTSISDGRHVAWAWVRSEVFKVLNTTPHSHI